jgi:hypothetical protein
MGKDNIFLEIEQVLKAERPTNVGFRHTNYAKHLFGIALRFKSKLYREDAERFHRALFMDANDYRESFANVINHHTWDAHMDELKVLLTPDRFPSKHALK